MGETGPRALLARVAARQWLAAVGAWWWRITLACAVVYAVVLGGVRLLALAPDFLHPATVLAVPGAALAAALLVARRPSAREAGREVDARMETDDLFLTAAMLDRCVGEFQPLVQRDAEAKAGAISPREVVPYRWLPGTRDGALALAALLAGVLWLPQLDPFGAGEVRKRDDRRRRELAQAKKATEIRKAAVKKEAAAESAEVKRAVDDLKKAFRQMKPKRKKENLERLMLSQKELGELWRKRNDQKLRDALTETPTYQRFGQMDAAKLAKWKQDLAKGKTGSLDRELAELKELAKELAKTGDPAGKEKARRELKRRLRELAEFASGEANSRQMSQAAKRALSQLEMSGKKGLSQEALAGLAQSLDLTQQEVQELARRARELATLEDALSAAQLAKAANAQKGLDGSSSASAQCDALKEYADLYGRLAGQGRGQGQGQGDGKGGDGKGGTGGAGQGRGGKPPENPDQDTDFKDEMSRSAVTAGRMLMKWKVKGPAEAGEAREEYRKNLERVKQSWMEAVVKEEVPPGYREAIKGYFNSLERNLPAAPAGAEVSPAGNVE